MPGAAKDYKVEVDIFIVNLMVTKAARKWHKFYNYLIKVISDAIKFLA